MTVKEAIEKRRSIRSYVDKSVSEEDLKTVLEAGRLAPSARNLQKWKFIAVEDKEKRLALKEACYNQKMVAEAPVTIVALSEESRIMPIGQDAAPIDTSIAMSFIMLQAAELGLGTCWLGMVDSEKVKKILNIPEPYQVIAVSPLGYPAEEGLPKKRKLFDEVICFNEFR